jgi:uncharacterized protein (TIGR02118 family)
MGGFKRIGLQRRRPDLSHEEFVAHWVNVHAELAKRLPKVRRYSINVIDRERYPFLDYDGFSELWFDSQADCEAAFKSPAGVTLLADLKNYVESVDPVFIEEHQVVWP